MIVTVFEVKTRNADGKRTNVLQRTTEHPTEESGKAKILDCIKHRLGSYPFLKYDELNDAYVMENLAGTNSWYLYLDIEN